MKRSDYPDFDFDGKKFSELVGKAQYILTQTAFAKKANLSTNFINKCIRNKLRTVPTPATIKKIAIASDGRVSYSELLEAAGYDPMKYNCSEFTKRVSKSATFPTITYRIVHNTLRICRDKGISIPGVEKGIGRPVGYISDFTKDIEHDTNLTVDDAYKISLLIGETLPDLIERDYTIEKIHRDMKKLGFKGKKSRKNFRY